MMRMNCYILLFLPSLLCIEEAVKKNLCKIGDSEIDDGGEFYMYSSVLTSSLILGPCQSGTKDNVSTLTKMVSVERKLWARDSMWVRMGRSSVTVTR